MHRKLKQRVLANGPSQDSEVELDCAAWLIGNNLANGKVLLDHTRPGDHVQSIIWHGTTLTGDKYLKSSSVVDFFLNPYVVAAVTAVATIVFKYFIDGSTL